MQSDRAQAAWFYDGLGWLDNHKKQVVQGGIALAVFALVVSFYFYNRAQKEEAASAALSRLIVTRASADDLLKFQTENRSTQAAPKALLLAAQELFLAGRYAEAQGQFQKFRQDYRNNSFIATAILGVASCLDAQGKTDEAIPVYTEVTQRQGADMQALQAQFALARLYETKGQPDKALESYQIVVKIGGNSDLANESGVRAVELLAEHPNLMRPAPVSGMAPSSALAPAGTRPVPPAK